MADRPAVIVIAITPLGSGVKDGPCSRVVARAGFSHGGRGGGAGERLLVFVQRNRHAGVSRVTGGGRIVAEAALYADIGPLRDRRSRGSSGGSAGSGGRERRGDSTGGERYRDPAWPADQPHRPRARRVPGGRRLGQGLRELREFAGRRVRPQAAAPGRR